MVCGAVVARDVVYKGAELGELQLAWASTVHKAQGSECPVVILALANMHRPLLSRRLLYTGWSCVCLHGTSGAVFMQDTSSQHYCCKLVGLVVARYGMTVFVLT